MARRRPAPRDRQRDHAIGRAAERYGLCLRPCDFARACQAIGNGAGERIGQTPIGDTVVVLAISDGAGRSATVVAVWKRTERRIATFLPADAHELWRWQATHPNQSRAEA
ncbi:MAG: hypothetical protein GC168_20455 [Candidatus Hydrogenedens sp.]|nr:hypothetical protein [Candidatus Hydrogenedens sp.]